MEFKKVKKEELQELLKREGYSFTSKMTPREVVSIREIHETLDHEVRTMFEDVDYNSFEYYVYETPDNYVYSSVFKGNIKK